MNGVVRTLINKIFDLTNQDQAQTGVNAEEQAAHRWEAAQQQLKQSKTYSAVLHVVMGKFALQKDVVQHLRGKRNRKVRVNQHNAAKALEEYNALHAKVQEVRAQNKETHQLKCVSAKNNGKMQW